MAENTSSSSIHAGKTVKECEAMIQKSLRNPMVKFLRERLQKAGCPVGNNLIRAVDARGKGYSSAYVSGGAIKVCSNAVYFQDDVNQLVIHNPIHAFDDCRVANMDWTNCAHRACSAECIRRRVMASLQRNPFCSEVATKDAMKVIRDVCCNDTQPFNKAS